MTDINDLITSIKTRVSTVLGVSYSEAGYGIDISKNSKGNTNNVYTVLPQSLVSSTTVTRSVTIDQEFMVKVSKEFINQKMSDSQQRTAEITLMQLGVDIYVDLVDTKCGLAGTCLNVTSLDIDDPLVISNNVASIEMSFIVKYRTLI